MFLQATRQGCDQWCPQEHQVPLVLWCPGKLLTGALKPIPSLFFSLLFIWPLTITLQSSDELAITWSLWGHHSMSNTGAVCPETTGWALSRRPVCKNKRRGREWRLFWCIRDLFQVATLTFQCLCSVFLYSMKWAFCFENMAHGKPYDENQQTQLFLGSLYQHRWSGRASNKPTTFISPNLLVTNIQNWKNAFKGLSQVQVDQRHPVPISLISIAFINRWEIKRVASHHAHQTLVYKIKHREALIKSITLKEIWLQN